MPASEPASRGGYPGRDHREADQDRILAFVAEIALGALVTSDGGDGFACTHLPFTVLARDGAVVLHAHMPRGNPQARTSGPAMVLFQGPHAYVRPGWYASKKVDGRAVPTWNYMVARLHGTLEIVDDSAFVLDQVTALSARHEVGQPEPWSPFDAPPKYLAGMVRALVGLRMVVTRVEGIWKLSQNHPKQNRLGVIAGLRIRGGEQATSVAEAMELREVARDTDGLS